MSTAAYQREWKTRNPDRWKTYSQRWIQNNSGASRAARRAWTKANRPKENARYKRWYDKNGKRLAAKRKLNPLLVLRRRVAASVRNALRKRRAVASAKTIPFLGCSIESFKLYLESKFEVGMSWENYGKWEIDHIIPCALFDLHKPQHQRRCFHFSNLQPLWGPVNRAKGARLFHEPGFLHL